MKKSLAINKGGDAAPAIDASAMGIAHATHVPDASFGKREFAKAEGTPQVDAQAFNIAGALKAPKPPSVINAVDKTQAVRNNSEGY